MGVDLSDILIKHPTTMREQQGRKLSIDAYNIMYQFLSSIRQPDGTPLLDSNGNVTSHLSGLFYRTVNMVEAGIKPVYVFDGKPSELKDRTIEARRLMKEKTRIELEAAIEAGNEERARSLSSRINYITHEMVEESKELLSYMGIPWIQAPSEGEAQASVMSRDNIVDGVVSQDYDCLLFGARLVLRNLTLIGKRKLPGRNIYVNVSPEYVDLQENLRALGITRDQLIEIGIMIGTDFNAGLDRVGAKTALNLIRRHGSIREILRARDESIDNLDEILELFRNPPHVEVQSIAFSRPDVDAVREFLCERHSFSPSRVDPYLQNLVEITKSQSQSNLDSFL